MHLYAAAALLLGISPIFVAAHPFLDITEAASEDVLSKRAPAVPNKSKVQSLASGTCDMDSASLPVAPTPLPSPTGLTLTHVAIGRGTQNYTCANASSAAVPVAAGAVARLYNCSCIAATSPDLLTTMPLIAMRYPVPTSNNALAPANVLLSGHHYFTDATTPFFDLVTDAHAYGTAAMKKANASDAPDKANNVPWLRLIAKEQVVAGAVNAWKEVYRVNTVGGVPPVNCEGRENILTMDYSAEYYFYA